MFLPGALEMSFEPTEAPFWRNGQSSSREMMLKIKSYVSRYQQLPEEQRKWAESVYFNSQLAEYLFQVNFIEGEGFASFEETKEAISQGLVDDVTLENRLRRRSDEREEHVRCLYKAWSWIFRAENLSLNVRQLIKGHQMLLGSTNPGLAGRLRCNANANEIVGCRIGEGVGDIHLFMYPSKVPEALKNLLNKTMSALEEISASRGEDRVNKFVALAGSFFFEFESIHPFLDGNGRVGRILLARLLKSIMPFPNVLLVEESTATMQPEPPFVDKQIYYKCHRTAQGKQVHKLEKDGRIALPGPEEINNMIDHPCDITALIMEGVYVCWKRFFDSLERHFPNNSKTSGRRQPPHHRRK